MRNAYCTNEIKKRPRRAFHSRLFALLSFLLLPLTFTLPARAAITQSINYQGFLLSKITNLPVETPQDIKFIIYDAATAGTARFTESRCNVKVSKGRYDVEIGSATSGGIPVNLFTDYSGLWLEIQVDSDGDCFGTYEAMIPRVRLQASPYAFNSMFASTASVATSTFSVNIIGALPNTTNGAVTISTNLFVMGGISVGDITPGSKLSVSGMVESKAGPLGYDDCSNPEHYSCGFKFPDGSVQTKAAALTMWDVSGDNLHTINPGNTGIGDMGLGSPVLVPLARLHISSGTSAAATIGNLLLVTAGSDEIFRVAGNGGAGEVHGGSYYGDGTTLTGIVRKAGDTMTGPLLITGSSLTVTSALGVNSFKLKLNDNVEISSAPYYYKGGILVSTHIYLPSGTFYGDGSGLTNVTSLPDSTKVLKTGDVMSGSLSGITSLTAASATITGSAFSVGGSTFSVQYGNTSLGGASYVERLNVNGSIRATSSVTANSGDFANSVTAPRGYFSGQVTALDILASTATFRAWSGPDMNNSYSITTASGIKVIAGVVFSSFGFIGDGSHLWNVSGTDSNRVLRTGDTMTGHLLIDKSSIAVVSNSALDYALTVKRDDVNITDPGATYVLAVTTYGNVGVQVLSPAAPLEVNREILISNSGIVGPRAQLHLKATDGDNFIRWSDPNAMGGGNLGVLGYQYGYLDLVYRAMGSDPFTGGQEVFRIGLPTLSVDPDSWQFGIGTTGPGQTREKFHILTNVLVSTSVNNAILFISTAAGRVSINTAAQTHALTVNGGISAVSSVTAGGGYYGNQSGVVTVTGSEIQLNGKTGIGVGSAAMPDSEVYVAEDGGLDFSFAVGNNAFNSYDFAVTPGGRVGIGLNKAVSAVPSNNLQVMDSIRIGAETYGDNEAYLSLRPAAGPSYIVWSEASDTNHLKGALGFATNSKDFVYRAGASDITNGIEVFRITNDILGVDFSGWKFGIGTSDPAEKFHVATNMLVSATGLNSPALFVSTGSGFVGISTGAPQAGLHDASNFLVGVARASAALYVSSITGNVGISTGSPQAKLDVNGMALFRSSVTISGAGLSGTQSAFEVIGSTLVVRYDGKVGIGVAVPAERLEVAGKVKATGFVASREIKNTVCNAAATCTAICTAGKVVLGGGCSYAVGVDSMTATYPSGNTSWECDYTGSTGNITAYAICSTLE